MSSSTTTCTECGTTIPDGSPGGFCAECLLRLALKPVQNGDGVQSPKSKAQSHDPLIEKTGDWIGRYRLLEEIGHGGCGVVYMAEQEKPVRRKVALKVIKLGMDTRQVVARFEAERQALALMDHSNIAKVLDAGATDTGRPYFVMELVGGIRITDYCEKENLTTRERLKLIIQVCRAVQHAHQKGIIHRDIKPSNVLVAAQDGVLIPKVIDFGIAKATQGRLTDQTLFTAFEQFIGTPAYMSPEQAQLGGLDVDTRSDIYSLGVLLYELLTGKTPFDSKELLAGGLDGMRRTILEKEPLTPSTRLKQEDAVRQGGQNESKIKNQKSKIANDLDWIVMKCLEKDRARRYETANGLATDIERHLNNQPVVARPPSRLYEFQKTVRRHKFGFAAAATVILALAAGALVSTLQAIRATRAEREQSRLRTRAEANEQKAQTEAARSAQVAQFMQDMLKGVGPSVARGRDTTLLREILDKTGERVGKDLKDQPLIQADLWTVLGEVYASLGEYDKAEVMTREALALRRRVLGEANLDVAESLKKLAGVLKDQKRPAEAETLLREALAVQRKILGNEHASIAATLDDLGRMAREQNRLAEAETLHRDALEMRRKLAPDDPQALASSLDNLAKVLNKEDRYVEAEHLGREGLELTTKLFGEEPHPDVDKFIGDLVGSLRGQDRLDEAEVLSRKEVATRRKLYGPGSRALRDALDGLAWILQGQGKWGEAEEAWREAVTRGDHVRLNGLAWLLATCPDPKFRDGPGAVAFAEKAVEATGRTNAMYLDTLAAACAAACQFTNAVRVEREAIALLQDGEVKRDYASRLQIFETSEPYGDHGKLATSAYYLLTQGKFAQAEILQRECLALREREIPEDWRTFNMKSELGGALLGQKKYAEAEPFLISGYEGMKEREATISAAGKSRLKEALERLLQFCEATDRPDQAAVWKKEVERFDLAQTNKQ